MQAGNVGGLIDRFVDFAGKPHKLGRFSEKVTETLLPLEKASATGMCAGVFCGFVWGYCSGTDCGGYGEYIRVTPTCRPTTGECYDREKSTGICC